MPRMGLLPQRKVVPLQRRAKHARHAPWTSALARLDARVAELERNMAALDRRMTALGKHGRMKAALACSVLFHAFLILGVSFKMPDPPRDTPQALEVTLVNAKSPTKPLKADALAQANLDGGGNTDARRRAKSPLPVPAEAKDTTELSMAQKRVEQLEREAKQLMTQAKSKAAVATLPDTPPQPKEESQVATDTSDLWARRLEIARLEASIARDWESYQQRPRRRFIGARTQEFRFARYIEDWRAKVERVGETNYPQAARDQRIYGSLVVTVSIKADGSIERVDINRSSGQRILDAAALHIVRLASPFAAFPPDIARDTDILSITRTWVFTRSDQFVAE